MQAAVAQNKPKFQPVTLTLVLDTQEELDVLVAMLEYSSTIPAKVAEWKVMSQDEERTLSKLMSAIYQPLRPLGCKKWTF